MPNSLYTAKPQTWFKIDAAGALLSFIMLMLVLPACSTWIGMPTPVLKVLAWIALALFVYSASCALWIRSEWRSFLRNISVANFCYVLLTLVFVVQNFSQLTLLGLAYFAGEMAIITLLAWLEWNRARVV